MAVRKVGGGGPVLRVTVKAAAPSVGGYALPTAPAKVDFNLRHYTILLYGREKIGKTSFFARCPDALFWCTEPGAKGLPVYQFNVEHGGVTSWAVARACVDLLEKAPKDRFPFVIVDTVDLLYDQCLAWVCEQLGIPHPGENAAGQKDWGKSWNAVKVEFMKLIYRILATGRGVGFISHAKEEEVNTRSGEKYTHIRPSMSGQAQAVIGAIVDIALYADYVKDATGSTRRILVCEGDELIWAGVRTSPTGSFPAILPLDKARGFDVLREAFETGKGGIPLSTLRAARTTTSVGRQFLDRKRLTRKEG